MPEADNRSEVERLLDGSFDLETTPSKMEALVQTGNRWYLELREYLHEPVDGDTVNNERILTVADEDFLLGDLPALEAKRGIVGVDLFVAKGAGEDADENTEWYRKSVDTGMGGNLVGVVSDPERYRHVVGSSKSDEGDPVAAAHLVEWGKAHGIDMSENNAKAIPTKVLEARKIEIEKLLTKIAEAKQRADRVRLDEVGADYIQRDDLVRQMQKIV